MADNAEQKAEQGVPQVPFVHKLKRPITVEEKDEKGNTVNKVVFTQVRFVREPELADLRKIFKKVDRFDRLIAAIDRLSDWPKEHLDALEHLNFRDVDGLGEAIRPFFESEDEPTPEDGSSPGASSA